MFKSRLVRDLAWVISSPPLITGEFNDTRWWNHQDCLNEFADCLPLLKKLDKNPEPLQTHLDKIKSKRLGYRFEGLIAYWLKISPNYKMLLRNIQIIKEGHTFGEIDFIIQELKSQKTIHLEVSVKFYLGSPPYEDSYRWFGTNVQDQLGKKVEHLKTHQTQLGKKHESFLEELGFKINQRHCILKGRLFYPSTVDVPPHGAASNHLRGRWVQGAEKSNSGLFYPLEKSEWLAELNHEDFDEERLQTSFSKHEWAQCYVDVVKDTSGNFCESSRIFHLPDRFKFPEYKK